MVNKMSECKPAAASTTPTSSCERIISEFQAQGRPDNPAYVAEGSVLGGFQIKTPKVGDGFVEWAIKGYDLEGKAPAASTETNYDKHGDWMFDKIAITLPVSHPGDNSIQDVYDTKKGK